MCRQTLVFGKRREHVVDWDDGGKKEKLYTIGGKLGRCR